MLYSSMLRTVAVAGLVLLAIPAAAIDGGAIANAQPAPLVQPDASQPAASDSRPAATQFVRPNVIDANIRNSQLILADLKKTFQAGQVQAESGTGTSQDNRMGLLCMLVAEKIPYMINKHIDDNAEREAAMAEARKAEEYVNKTLLPAFNKAMQSKKPDDARPGCAAG